MCLLYFAVIAYLGISALVLWLLPHKVGIPLVAVMGVILAVVIWKIMGFIKKVKKAVGGLVPQKQLCSLAPGERFHGNGFAFAFPVACEVSQTKFHEVEALMLKPGFDFPGAPKDTLLIVSTFPPQELKPRISEDLQKVFARVEGHGGDPAPVQIGPLKGERQTFSTAKDGKDVRGEAVFLGDDRCSIVWVAIAEGGNFDTLAAKYRELALLIERVDTSPPAPSTV